MPGLEADAAAGHVDARDDVVSKGFGADASEIVDLGAAMEAAIGIGRSDEVGRVSKLSGAGSSGGGGGSDAALGGAAGPAKPRRLRPVAVVARKSLVETVGWERALAKQISRLWQTHNGRNNAPIRHE